MALKKMIFDYRQKLKEKVESGQGKSPLSFYPNVEIKGSRELSISRHEGLLDYGKEEIIIGGKGEKYIVSGKNMVIAVMNSDFIGIRGQLLNLKIEKGETK